MPNRLASEQSIYLRQHAENPVDWYPWGEEAFARARAEDKPILLSIGYSACHWCHVMARESFADARTAALMNERFVNVKVDREERADVDDLYMHAVQAFTGSGGWPMTVFLMPDGRPFYAGTYYPPEARGDAPSFRDVLEYAATLYRERKEDLERIAGQAEQVLSAASRLPPAAESLSDDWLDRLAEDADRAFDPEHGGFMTAPKFPPHHTLPALLAHWRRTGRGRSLAMVETTLRQMARGGIYDLLGGGFSRYAVDAGWRVPHFEKMLYDSAQLVPTTLDAWLVTGREGYRRVVRETVGWLLREMRTDDGAFAAALSAESEGEEGRFYLFTPDDLREALGKDAPAAAALLGVTVREAPRLRAPLEDLAEDERALWERVRPRLAAWRSARVRPERDDKVVAGWNGITIGALARAGAVLEQPGWLDAARAAAEAVWTGNRPDGRLRRTGTVDATLEDHAGLLSGLVDLYEATFEGPWLDRALVLADEAVELFWDPAEGGFFFTAHDAEPLVARSRRLLGGQEPSGNGLIALAFLRLEALVGRTDLGDRARHLLRSLQGFVDQAPRVLGPAVLAAAWQAGPVREVAFAGRDVSDLVRTVRRRYDPFRVLALRDPERIPWTEPQEPVGGRGTAFLCEGHACRAPTTSPEELAAMLEETPELRPARLGGARVRAPRLPDEGWLNGGPLDLEGNVAVLDFWTSCCVNCHHVLPALAAVEERFAGEPVVVVGVHSAKFPAEKEPEHVARALRRHDVRHPVVLDPEHDLWDRFAVRSWPTVMVVDATGRIAWQQSGEVEPARLLDVVATVLEEGRDLDQLGEPVWRRPEAGPRERALRFPGKVHVWPETQAQAVGADPFGSNAHLYVADTGNHRLLEARLSLGEDGWPHARVIRVYGDGTAGHEDGTTPRFREPQGIHRTLNTLWVADTGNHALRAIDLLSGEVRTEVGSGRLGRGGPLDPTEPLEMDLRSPWDVVANDELCVIAMAGSHQLWIHVPSQGRAGPFVGSGAEGHVDGEPPEAALAQPSGLVLYGQLLFWVDAESSSVRVFDFGNRTVTTVVGRGLFDFGDVDGPSEQARLQHPLGIDFAEGVAFVADTYNGKIKAVDLRDDNTTVTVAEGLVEPGDVALAGPFLIVAETGNHRIAVVHRESGETRELVWD